MNRSNTLGALVVLSLVAATACGGQADATRTPKTTQPNGVASVAVPSPAVATSATPAAAPTASPAPVASAAPGPAPAAPADSGSPRIDDENVYAPDHTIAAANVPLLDADQKPLPQTDARPTVTSQIFDARMRLLARAITTGNADAALPTFFPAVAYAQVKDIPSPEKDWEHRLVGAFRRDIAEYHAKLGKDAASAKLVSVEVPEGAAKFMKPGSEGNRLGYYRVLRSKLVFQLPSGKEEPLELTSMISWRGEWYVVHLHGFK